MRVLVGWIVLSACYRPTGAGECVSTCAHDVDCPGELACGVDGLCRDRAALDCRDRSTTDAFPVGDGGPVCFGGGTSLLQPAFCRSAFPAGIDLHAFDTDNDCSGDGFEAVMQTSGPTVCIVYAQMITVVTANVRITGTRPLVLASVSDVRISGGLDVASFHSFAAGAGASSGGCQGGNGLAGGGGAAGGSFKGMGGDGGQSVTTMQTPASPALPTPTFIRSGCAGGIGGAASASSGQGGASGGTVHIIAKGNIMISGIVNANGEGGSGCAMSQGGHGGGSGGYVGLEAHMITVGSGGVVTALGGGGGAGGNGAFGGIFGDDPNGTIPASGGTGMNSGSGGDGSPTSNPSNGRPGAGTSLSGAGGGGGGGGGGYIIIDGDLQSSGRLVPPPG